MSWSPFTGVSSTKEAKERWVIEGKVYDFNKWQYRHPGGAIWFRWNAGRDITILYHCYHYDTKKGSKMDALLDKYLDAGVTEKDLNMGKPEHGAPPFLLPPGYEPMRDGPRFQFNNKGGFLTTLKDRIHTDEHQAVVKKMDTLFDQVCIAMLVLFAFLHLLVQFEALNWVLLGFLLAACRTALGGWGHYYVHQAKPNFSEGLFDINYVGTSLIGMDGHIAHHALTQTPMDPKRTFFYGMLGLHKFWRPFGYTIHKFGLIVSGMFIRGFEINFFEADKGHFRKEFWFARTVLFLELVLCWQTSKMWVWTLQFLLSLWFNTFMIVASHEFEEAHYSGKDTDWGIFQVTNSFDFTVVGNRWLDLAFSAGLSPHRAHHLLPYQKSGFANLASEDIIRGVCKEFDIKWEKPRNFWTERLPHLMRHYLKSDALDPQTRQLKGVGPFHPTSLIDLVKFIATGFLGVGAV